MTVSPLRTRLLDSQPLCPKWDELPLPSIPPEFLVELAIAGTYQTINLAFLF